MYIYIYIYIYIFIFIVYNFKLLIVGATMRYNIHVSWCNGLHNSYAIYLFFIENSYYLV